MIHRFAFVWLSIFSVAATAQAAPAVAPQNGKPESLTKRYEWYDKTFVGAYDTAGVKDARWAALAKRALTAAATMSSHNPRANDDEEELIFLATMQAIRMQGCNDPLVLYANGR